MERKGTSSIFVHFFGMGRERGGVTKAEERKLRKMEIRIAELERNLKISQDSWRDSFSGQFEIRYALVAAFAALEEAMVILHEALKNDNLYKNEQKRVEIIGDF